MPKNYTTDLKVLVGRTVTEAFINQDRDYVMLHTTTGPLFLTWVGDCCAHCYLAHVSGADVLVGAAISDAYNTEWAREERSDYDVIESMGTTIKTNKGYVTFESRVEHNGYYGGSLLISGDEPLDQYHYPKYEWDEKPEMKTLEDF